MKLFFSILLNKHSVIKFLKNKHSLTWLHLPATISFSHPLNLYVNSLLDLLTRLLSPKALMYQCSKEKTQVLQKFLYELEESCEILSFLFLP